jgi:hypothetical protein
VGSSASLERVPGKNNWIEHADGELPPYIREIARSVEKTGKTLSQSIAIAISRVKVWAAGGDGVSPKTQAKAAKALAAWESLKAKNKARKGKTVKASWTDELQVAADLVQLSTLDALLIRVEHEQLGDAGAVALSSVLKSAATRT